MQELERDPIFRLDDIHDLSKDQIRERTMVRTPKLPQLRLPAPRLIFHACL